MTDRETIAQLETRLAESESLRASHQREIDSLKAKLAEIGKLLSENGCDCECDHCNEGHGDDCKRCLACRISDEVTK